MTDDPNEKPCAAADEPAQEAATPAEAAAGQETPPQKSQEPAQEPHSGDEAAKVAALEAELAAAKDRALRLLADCDNLRKRTARELEERTARANERLLGDLIPVFDHFELALQSAPAGAADGFAQGVRMIADEFRKVLERSGAEVIDASAEGTPFDPMSHEALSAVPHATVPKDCVVSQFRKGWRLGGKVLRPAQVIVSAGAPAQPAEQPQEA